MKIQFSDIENGKILFLEESLDIYTSLSLKEKIEDIKVSMGEHVIADLSLVKYVDSSGIGTLIKILNHVHDHKAKFFYNRPLSSHSKSVQGSRAYDLFSNSFY